MARQLKNLRDLLVEKMSETDMTTVQVMDFIDDYIDTEETKYNEMKDKITEMLEK